MVTHVTLSFRGIFNCFYFNIPFMESGWGIFGHFCNLSVGDFWLCLWSLELWIVDCLEFLGSLYEVGLVFFLLCFCVWKISYLYELKMVICLCYCMWIMDVYVDIFIVFFSIHHACDGFWSVREEGGIPSHHMSWWASHGGFLYSSPHMVWCREKIVIWFDAGKIFSYGLDLFPHPWKGNHNGLKNPFK